MRKRILICPWHHWCFNQLSGTLKKKVLSELYNNIDEHRTLAAQNVFLKQAPYLLSMVTHCRNSEHSLSEFHRGRFIRRLKLEPKKILHSTLLLSVCGRGLWGLHPTLLCLEGNWPLLYLWRLRMKESKLHPAPAAPGSHPFSFFPCLPFH